MPLRIHEAGVSPSRASIVFKIEVNRGRDPITGYDRPHVLRTIGKGVAVVQDGKRHNIYVHDKRNDWRLHLGTFIGNASGGAIKEPGYNARFEDLPKGHSRNLLLDIVVEAIASKKRLARRKQKHIGNTRRVR